MEIEAIVSLVMTGLAILAGGFWLKAKGKLADVAFLIGQTYELITFVAGALEDNKLTKEETETLKKEAQDVKEAWEKLIGK